MSDDEQYAYGEMCTWHGPLTFVSATIGTGLFAGRKACPSCGEPLIEIAAWQFWANAKATEPKLPGYDDMMRWSEGKCFQYFDTLQNAYRQAMEGQV